METGNELDDFIARNQKYVSLKDGESWKGVYQGFTMGINSFGNEAIYWKFKPIGKDNIVTWQCGQTGVAVEMKKFKKGDCLKITRRGSKENPPTKYFIEESEPF